MASLTKSSKNVPKYRLYLRLTRSGPDKNDISGRPKRYTVFCSKAVPPDPLFIGHEAEQMVIRLMDKIHKVVM